MIDPHPLERDEVRLFRQLVRGFAKDLGQYADDWEEDGYFPDWVFSRAGELGIFGAHYPESVGGGGGDYWFSVVKCEELHWCASMGVSLGLMVQSDMATPCIRSLGTAEQKEEFLRPALAGEKIAALAMTESDAGSDLMAIRTTATKQGDEYSLSGSKTYVTNGARAHFMTVLAKTVDAGSEGLSLFLVPTDIPGLERSAPMKKIGHRASDTCEVFFENCRIPKRYLLGEAGQGLSYIVVDLQEERLAVCAAALGRSRRALERTIEYARERIVMGEPLIKRESWRHRFAQLYSELEAAKRLTYAAVDLYNQQAYLNSVPLSTEALRLISMSKLVVPELSFRIMDTCLQCYGGMGYIEDTWIARAWRDERLLRIGGGTSEVMLHTIGRTLGF